MVNSLGFTVGAKLKYPMAATQPSDSKVLGFPFAVKCVMTLVGEIIIVVAFVETGSYPGMELKDTLVSEGRYLLPLYFQRHRQL